MAEKRHPRKDAAAAKLRYDTRRAAIDRLKLEQGCAMCGYNTHAAALEFDHIDPLTKSFGIAAAIGTRKLAVLLAEIEKCQVLCANCHRIKSMEDQAMLRRAGRPITSTLTINMRDHPSLFSKEADGA